MEEIVETGIQLRAHQEKASINSGKHKRLRNSRDKIAFEKIKESFFVEPKDHHAEQVFKDAHRRKDVEEPVFGIVACKPEIIRKSEEYGIVIVDHDIVCIQFVETVQSIGVGVSIGDRLSDKPYDIILRYKKI